MDILFVFERARQRLLTVYQSKSLKKVLHDTSTHKFYVDNGVELDLQEYEE